MFINKNMYTRVVCNRGMGAPTNMKTSIHGKYILYRNTSSSYMDEASTEDVFFVFHIGRYHNHHYFTMGRTYDMHATDLYHQHALPVASCIYLVPIGRHVTSLDAMCNYTRALRATNSPVTGFALPPYGSDHWIVVLDAYEDIRPLLEKADILFNTNSRFDTN